MVSEQIKRFNNTLTILMGGYIDPVINNSVGKEIGLAL